MLLITKNYKNEQCLLHIIKWHSIFFDLREINSRRDMLVFSDDKEETD